MFLRLSVRWYVLQQCCPTSRSRSTGRPRTVPTSAARAVRRN